MGNSVAGLLHLVVRAIKGSEGKTQFCVCVWMSLDHIVGSIRVDIKDLSELRLDQAMEGKLGDTRGGRIHELNARSSYGESLRVDGSVAEVF